MFEQAVPFTLAFFEVNLNNNQQFQPYLQSSYAQFLSENQEYKLSLITGDSTPKLKTSIENFRRENNLK
ncbi:hypothetical protein [Geminocystis herdmanii]|uniref:hypothetical protein n=1 Tax=Geminocystis herdmanii TaxID=669359 RepID=UPI00034DB7AD|nr:hypothetical protein [Geminocystis herdmanii]